MKRVLILTDKLSVSENLFDADKFVAQLQRSSKEIEVEVCFFEDLVYELSTGKTKIYHKSRGYDIADFDVVYRKRSENIPQHPISCSLHVRAKGKVFLDTEFNSQMNANANKLVEHLLYALYKLPFPATMIVTKNNKDDLLNGIELTFPKVLKSLMGTRGNHNHLVGSVQDIHRIIDDADERNSEFALQEFIENDSDYRFLVLGYETKLVIRRKRAENSNSHTNNTSKGASAEIVELDTLDQSLIELANKAAKNFRREIAGVDIMVGLKDGKSYILEVNRSPQIEQGAFVEDKSALVAEYFSSL